MSTSGTASSTRPAATCCRVRTSKARSAGCGPATGSFSRAPARASSRTMSSARSCAACWRRQTPVALPAPEPAVAAARTRRARPLAGPVVPLTASIGGGNELLGGGPARPAGSDPLATRVLVRGEPVTAPVGRADNFAWPRSGVDTHPRRRARGLAGVAATADATPQPASLPAATQQPPAQRPAPQRPAARPPAQQQPGQQAPRPRSRRAEAAAGAASAEAAATREQ